MTKKSAIIFNPFVYINTKQKKILFYNTLSFDSIVLEESTLFKIIKQRLKNENNLNIIKIDKKLLSSKDLKNFINEASLKNIIQVVPYYKKEPVQLKPNIFLVSDINKLQINKSKENYAYFSSFNKISALLNETSIYINSYSKEITNDTFKQFSGYISSHNKTELDFDLFKDIIAQLKKTKNQTINILGGNPFIHSSIDKIISELNSYTIYKNYHYHYLANTIKLEVDDYSSITIHITFPVKKNYFDKSKNNPSIPRCFNFIVTNNKEYQESIEIIKQHKIENYSFSPFLKNDNIDFLKTNLLLDENEILKMRLGQQDIFINENINTNYFGKLTIIPTGEVYSNTNLASLGNIGNKSIIELADKEFHSNNSWRKLRKNITPCKSCIYNSICPPISNFDYLLNHFDLCKIRK